jgi:rhamnosyl/mannosyltransferase
MSGTGIRVVHLGKYYPPSSGGIETYTQTLAQSQADLGADVEVVVVNHVTAGGRDATFDCLARTAVSEETEGPVRITRVARWANIGKLDVAPELLRVVHRILRRPPTVWHLHVPNVTMMLAIIASPRIRPLVITHHSDVVRQQLLGRVIRPLERAVYRRASRILPTSPSYIDGSELLRRFEDKLTVLPLGVDQASIREPSTAALAAAERLRTELPGPIWLCVGRLIYYKGLRVALAALRDVPGTLLVIGSGPMAGELKVEAERLGVADRVVWHGTAADDSLVAAYHVATALWFPSIARSEAFGLVQIEAMAAGCPVINTSIPGSGVAWVCRHEREGLTVSVNDPHELGAAAKRLLTEPGLRERLGRAGRVRAAEFGHQLLSERSLSIYREVANS